MSTILNRLIVIYIVMVIMGCGLIPLADSFILRVLKQKIKLKRLNDIIKKKSIAFNNYIFL